jgi:2-methylisocitrate lyase-like PEP mutase family enzyme
MSAGLSPAEVGERAGKLAGMTNGRETRITARMEWNGDDLGAAIARFRAYILAGADAVAVHFGPAEDYGQRMTVFAEGVADL